MISDDDDDGATWDILEMALRGGQVRAIALPAPKSRRPVPLPVEWWQTISHDEYCDIILRTTLTPAQIESLWRLTDRSGRLPKRLEIRFVAEDVRRFKPSVDRAGRA